MRGQEKKRRKKELEKRGLKKMEVNGYMMEKMDIFGVGKENLLLKMILLRMKC